MSSFFSLFWVDFSLFFDIRIPGKHRHFGTVFDFGIPFDLARLFPGARGKKRSNSFLNYFSQYRQSGTEIAWCAYHANRANPANSSNPGGGANRANHTKGGKGGGGTKGCNLATVALPTIFTKNGAFCV